MCNFRVGQKVVAITPQAKSWFGKDPITVHQVICCQNCGGVHLTISEYPCEMCYFDCSSCKRDIVKTNKEGCKSSHFRPLITDYTEEELASVDISPLIEELELETV